MDVNGLFKIFCGCFFSSFLTIRAYCAWKWEKNEQVEDKRKCVRSQNLSRGDEQHLVLKKQVKMREKSSQVKFGHLKNSKISPAS